jgi:predicted HTH domain antitoxin
VAVIVELPDDVEIRLRAATGDLEREGKEAMLVELYRQEKLSRHELALSLGLSRLETDAVLKKHGVTEDLPTLQDLEDDLREARALLGR